MNKLNLAIITASICLFNLIGITGAAAQSVRSVEYYSPTGQPFQVGSIETAVVESTGLVYSAGSTYGNRVAVISPNTNAAVAYIEAPTLTGTSGISNSAVNQTSKLVYFYAIGVNNIYVVDGRSASSTFNRMLSPIQFSDQLVRNIAIDEARQKLYITTSSSSSAITGQINIIDADPASPTFHQTLSVVPMPAGVPAFGAAVNSATNKIYVAAPAVTGGTAANQGVYVLNGATLSLTKIAGTSPTSVVILNTVENMIYSGGQTTQIQSIDGITDTVLTNIAGATTSISSNESLAVNKISGRVYFAFGDDKVFVIDGKRSSPTFNSLVATINNAGAGGIVVDESINKIAVIRFASGGNTTIIDGASNSIVATIPGQISPADIAVNTATHRIFVANQLFAVQHISLAKNALVATIATGADAGTGAVNSMNNTYYSPRAGALTDLPFFDANGIAGTVTGLPHNNGRFLSVVQNSATNRLYAVNSARNISNTSGFPSYVAVINPKNNSVVANVEILSQCLDAGVNEATNKIYVLCAGSGAANPGGISVINGATNTASVINTSAFPTNNPFFNGPVVVNTATNKIYVKTNSGTGGVIDGATDIATQLPYTGVVGIAVNKTLNRIYFLTNNSLRVLDGNNDAEIANIPLTSISGIAVNETTGQIFVTNPSEDTVTVINGGTNSIIGIIPTGDAPSRIAVNEAENRVYVGNNGSSFSLTFIDGNSLNAKKTIPLPLPVSSISISPQTKRLYLSSISPTGAGVMIINDSKSITSFDFDGDGKADRSVFRPTDGTWYISRSSAGFFALQYGISSDKLVPADYDGDGRTDVAIWRPSNGFFYIVNSSNFTLRFENLGVSGDIPTTGDWDGDGKADLSVYRDSASGTQSILYYRGSLNNPLGNITQTPWGIAGDKPVVGDFDGDGKSDAAIFRPSNNSWFILRSSDGQFIGITFGLSGDKLVPADFDGDGKTDIAIYRSGAWFIQQSSDNQVRNEVFGLAEDIPSPADYDGDGKADIAVYRNGVWYVKQSASGLVTNQFGLAGEKPVPSSYIP